MSIIDFHSHILPGVDDGSSSVEESIAMLRMEASQGIRHVIATPHFYPRHDTLEGFLKRRKEAEERLREEMEKYDDLPQVTVGAEVCFFFGISDSEVLKELTIGEEKCNLIEMPYAAWTDSMYRELEQIYMKQGLLPLIAHVDRYLGRFRTYGIPERLESLPVLVQFNASAFCDFGSSGRAMRMLKKKQIHLLGSDCHNLRTRLPNLGAAVANIKKRLGDDALIHIEDYQNSVIHL